MRSLFVVVAVAVLVIPLAVHGQQGGVTADGWDARLDRDGDAARVLSFMTMGTGVHATTAGAGAAIFWQPSSMAKGTYSISASFTQSGAATRWYKGSLHAHTINSDGDSPPYDVLTWYKRHGYHFLAITDHNTLTDPAGFDTNPTDPRHPRRI